MKNDGNRGDHDKEPENRIECGQGAECNMSCQGKQEGGHHQHEKWSRGLSRQSAPVMLEKKRMTDMPEQANEKICIHLVNHAARNEDYRFAFGFAQYTPIALSAYPFKSARFCRYSSRPTSPFA